jgi:hypothetical protein
MGWAGSVKKGQVGKKDTGVFREPWFFRVQDPLQPRRHLRIHYSIFISLGMVFLSVGVPAGALEDKTFSGKVSQEVGGVQAFGGTFRTYHTFRVLVESHNDLSPEFSLGLAGEGAWQAGPGLVPSWPLYPVENAVDLELNNFSNLTKADLLSLRLSRAFLRFSSGPLDATFGLQKPEWGASRSYRPTDYFFPLNPLTLTRDQPLGSLGADVSCFLFDDLSLEGAMRFLSGGVAEECIRLVNKGIGLTFTPSFAWMNGRNGFGLEAAGTFPQFQVRLEAVDWLYPDGRAAVNWNAGLSTVRDGVKYTAEVVRDETGEILGGDSNRRIQGTYVFISIEGTVLEEWKVTPSLVTPLEGGPFLFWPKASWDFSPSWQGIFEAQLLLGNWPGLLALRPNRAGISIAYAF